MYKNAYDIKNLNTSSARRFLFSIPKFSKETFFLDFGIFCIASMHIEYHSGMN
jgi:hypothetical protein